MEKENIIAQIETLNTCLISAKINGETEIAELIKTKLLKLISLL
jgi:hypothetical protein